MTVYANGLEVACKAQSNKVIAAFPDVCFTPPENPATPPGVPVPYPSFGLDSDTDSGTGTVKIGGQTITQKNKSYYTKTSGTEAGCAAKKGVITSVNTGKEYAVAWSSDVKADGEPVSRMTDLSTNNHASPTGNAPPWPKVGQLTVGGVDCATILANLGMKVHAYKHADKECSSSQQSDHILQNACFQNSRGGQAISTVSDYKIGDAPCVCLDDKTTRGTEHGEKTAEQGDWSKKQRATGKNPTYKEVREGNLNAMKKAKAPHMDDGPDGKEHPAVTCLRMICDAFFKDMMDGDDEAAKDSTQCRAPATGAFKQQATVTSGPV
ncbi:DUF4150 domain-containing protein [Mesorhizobium sp. ESP7-2]|uniref:DUF4150 domain-containing protein n=1 Tax=Mesorhizobium sp. ESP7-2 TaxID=2876622 RepID=UPI001CC92F65|nr:DUF4150 domain-containing protein [Mesorhizobium sp. ESP7-2]MBZ9708668.1 DUF4150 domain-containing protein [Mesorhizobium sp. ESP7-2]